MQVSVENINSIADIATSAATLIAGGFVYWKYFVQREGRAKIQIEADIGVLGRQAGSILVELRMTLHNKGNVRQIIREQSFNLFGLNSQAELEYGSDRINCQTRFQAIIKDRSWMPGRYSYTYIDAGTAQTYSYITHVPEDTSFLLLNSRFRYPGPRNELHGIQRAFRVDA